MADHLLTTFSPKVDLLVAMAPQAYQQFSGITKDQGLAVHSGPPADSVAHGEEIIRIKKSPGQRMTWPEPGAIPA